ncbi:MAG TPA: cyclic nucleotide-binding domain-containing protein [Thermodesulfovibrionales bacterium]|nr:cyclic nucleotide-binding domain-containing protein [Thermodesulfovibrionales bacterium]
MKARKLWEGLFISLKDKDWPGAMKSIDNIIESDRENPNHYLKKGDICLRTGDKAGAVNAYLRAAWYLDKGGFLKKALAVYKLVQRYDHDNDEALHESNRIMMKLGSMSEANKKAEWMIFPPEETPQETPKKTKDVSGPVQRSGQTGDDAVKSDTVVPMGFLSYFTGDEIEEILDRAEMKRFPDGKPVVREGDIGDSVYIIRKGSAAVVGLFFGKMRLIDILSEGDLFGEMAFLTGRTRTASVIARGELEVYEINKPLLEELVEKRPQILSQLSEIYIKRVRDTIRKIKTKRIC